MSFVYVFLGGGFGSVVRYGIAKIMEQNELDFPVATFIANVISCILLGYLIGLTLKNGIADNQKLLWMTGFCGGFSTFSTFSGEVYQLIQGGQLLLAAIYIFLSLFVCVICIWLGIIISQRV